MGLWSLYPEVTQLAYQKGCGKRGMILTGNIGFKLTPILD